jgi:PIN domain nuclease of toxin-antitoxin system
MQFLLDTHAFLWFILDNPKLSPAAKALIENPENSRWLSMASIWEMAKVYKRLEAIARQRHVIQRTITFPLAEFDMALAA